MFCVFSLPRSRSAWLAHWLRRDGLLVGHDISIECDEPGQFIASFQNGLAGTVETGAIEAWRLIRAALPQAKFLTVRRPLGEVEQSLARFGLEAREELLLREAMLDELEACGEAERVEFENLRYIPVRKWIWEYLRSDPFDSKWDAAYEITNIQVNMGERVKQLQRRAPAIAALRSQITSFSKSLPICPTLS